MGPAAPCAAHLLLLLALLPPASLPLVVRAPFPPGSTEGAAAVTAVATAAATIEPAPKKQAVTATGAGEIRLHGEADAGARGDFATTPDDLWFCRDRHHCHNHGACDASTGKCVCDHPWYGDDCANAVVNAEISGNDVHVSMLEPSPTGQDVRADGNEMFLAKAHHRLRQVVAELSLTSDGCERDAALCRERKRLMRMLGLSYTSPSTQTGHVFDTAQAPAKVAAAHPSNKGLPAVTTMRWNDRVNDDKPIILAVQEALKSAFKDTLAGRSHLHRAKWEHSDPSSLPNFPMTVEREHVGGKAMATSGEILPGMKIMFDKKTLPDTNEDKTGVIIHHMSALSKAVQEDAPEHVVKERVASLKKAVDNPDPASALNKRLKELVRVIAIEQNKPNVPEEEIESHLERAIERKITMLDKIVGGKSSKTDSAISDLSTAIARHSKPILVKNGLAALETALGEQPSQHVQDLMKDLKDVSGYSGAENNEGNSDGENHLKQRIAELDIAEEELTALEEGQHASLIPSASKAHPDSGGIHADSESKMDQVMSVTITLRGISKGILDGDDAREALTHEIGAIIGAPVDAITIDHITDAPMAQQQLLLPLFAVDIAIRVSVTSESVAKIVYSRMSDLFANVPSVVKKFTSKLAKSAGLKARVTGTKADGKSDVAESNAIAFVRATKPAWGQRKHDDKVSSMKHVEAAVADILRAVEHVEAGLFKYDHMGSRVTYRKPFKEVPEVFLGPPTKLGHNSVMGRLKSSDIISMDGWLSEPEDQGYDLWHLEEHGSWLSLAQGVHTTDEGTKFEVVSCVVKGRRLNRCRHSLGGGAGKNKTWVAIAQVANLSIPHKETRGQKDRDPEFKRVYVQVNDGDGSATITQQGGSWFNMHKDPRKFNGTATTVSVLFIPEGKGHINGKSYVATRMRVGHTATELTYGKEFEGALPAIFISSENRGGDPYTLRLEKRDVWNKKGCEVFADEGLLSKSKNKYHVDEKAQVLILQV